MKFLPVPLRLGLLAGVAAGFVLQPLSPLRADDYGGGSGGQHGGDGGGTGTQPDDHGKTEFLGTIQALPATADLTGVWTVDGRAVTVDASTLIRTEHGAPAVGGKVEIEGALQADGSSVQASVVKTEDAELEREDNVFFGTVQALPASGLIGTWQVGGLTVLVTDTTRVETEGADPVVGSTVRVEGVQQADASFLASDIEVQAADPNAPAPQKVKVKGTIEQLPATPGSKGNWVIDGVVVTVTDDSIHVEGGRKPKVGRKVVIKGQKQINGSVHASKVNVPKPTTSSCGG